MCSLEKSPVHPPTLRLQLGHPLSSSNGPPLLLASGPVSFSTHLAKVRAGGLLRVDTLNSDERLVGARVALSALVTEDAALGVETVEEEIARLGHRVSTVSTDWKLGRVWRQEGYREENARWSVRIDIESRRSARNGNGEVSGLSTGSCSLLATYRVEPIVCFFVLRDGERQWRV